jgi:hypothetical protein
MSARYEATGTWETTWQVSVRGATIIIEVRDLRDTRSGTVYRDGCHRVRITRAEALPGQPRSKTFKGESAWCNAERYAEDARNGFAYRAR